MSQIYIRNDNEKRMIIVVFNVIDDILIVGNIRHSNGLAQDIPKRYNVRTCLLMIQITLMDEPYDKLGMAIS